MTSNRKKIYIAVIIVCFLATGGVLYFGLKSPVAPTAPIVVSQGPETVGVTINNPDSGDGSQPASGGHRQPSVFPADNKFDWTLLESDTFKNLKPIPNLVLDPATIGRDNPFGK